MRKKNDKEDEVQSRDEAENYGQEIEVEDGTETPKKKSRKKSAEFEKNVIRDSKTAKAKGKNGGKRSGEVRRAKRDAREAARFILELAAIGGSKSNLKTMGVEPEDQTNMVALQARLYTMAMNGDLEAYRELMKIAGYEPEENRKERESVSSDIRKNKEIDAKVAALSRAGDKNAATAVNLYDEEENNDVVIYLPEIETEDDCQMPPEKSDLPVEGNDDTT